MSLSTGVNIFVRPASPATALYAHPDMNESGAGTPFFDLATGNDRGGATAPTIFGGMAWRDNERPDDTTSFAGAVGS